MRSRGGDHRCRYSASMSEPLIAHVRDLATGEIGLFSGTREITVPRSTTCRPIGPRHWLVASAAPCPAVLHKQTPKQTRATRPKQKPRYAMSSHREAPEISKDPVADSTDVYAFVSPMLPAL